MSENSLQSVLERAKRKPSADEAKPEGKARGGTKLIGGHFDPSVSAQLRMIAAEQGVTIQKLLEEAFDDLFAKKGKPRIAAR